MGVSRAIANAADRNEIIVAWDLKRHMNSVLSSAATILLPCFRPCASSQIFPFSPGRKLDRYCRSGKHVSFHVGRTALGVKLLQCCFLHLLFLLLLLFLHPPHAYTARTGSCNVRKNTSPVAQCTTLCTHRAAHPCTRVLRPKEIELILFFSATAKSQNDSLENVRLQQQQQPRLPPSCGSLIHPLLRQLLLSREGVKGWDGG